MQRKVWTAAQNTDRVDEIKTHRHTRARAQTRFSHGAGDDAHPLPLSRTFSNFSPAALPWPFLPLASLARLLARPFVRSLCTYTYACIMFICVPEQGVKHVIAVKEDCKVLDHKVRANTNKKRAGGGGRGAKECCLL